MTSDLGARLREALEANQRALAEAKAIIRGELGADWADSFNSFYELTCAAEKADELAALRPVIHGAQESTQTTYPVGASRETGQAEPNAAQDSGAHADAHGRTDGVLSTGPAVPPVTAQGDAPRRFDEELGEAVERVYQVYGSDLAAFQRDIQNTLARRKQAAQGDETPLARALADLDRERRDHTNTITQRDNAEGWADRLAYAIAGEDVIGEHSSCNNPWMNAEEQLELQREASSEAAPGERRLEADITTCRTCRVGACTHHAQTVYVEWFDHYTICIFCHRPLTMMTVAELASRGKEVPPNWPARRLSPCPVHQPTVQRPEPTA